MDFPDNGKIQNQFFKELVFPFCGATRSDITTGPAYGVDVAVVALPGGMAMAITSDPLSLVPTLGLRESAWLSVQLMANDMATTGYAAQYAQFVLNLPMTLSTQDFEVYWHHIHSDCKRMGIAITGGHTGRVEGMQSTVAGGGTMITVAAADSIITSQGAQPGDIIIMTRQCSLVATSILAMSFPNKVTEACGPAIQHAAASLFYQTSAVEAGLIAGDLHRHTKAVTAMHDVTEGGIIGALHEMAHASACGLYVHSDSIPVGNVQQKLGNLFEINPMHCVGAGSMIITVKPEHARRLIDQLHSEEIAAVAIGHITKQTDGLVLTRHDGERLLQHPGADPYWTAFFDAYQKGWT